MPKAARKGDIGSAHGCFPASPAIEGSDNVFINGIPALRVGDAYAAHGCSKCSPHGRHAAAGSATVNINGRPAVRVGDAIDCGGVAQTGSPNVNIGDVSWDGKTGEVNSKARFILSQVPNSTDYPYSSEPYRLYKNGALLKEGITDDEGIIELDDMPDEESTYMIEMSTGDKFELTESAFSPPETELGIQQRMGALGYLTDKDAIDMKGEEPAEQWKASLTTRSEDESEDWQQRLITELKQLFP